MKYVQGKFKPKNPEKYNGNPLNIFYRSSLELKMMIWLDNHPDVISYSSEEIIVKYFDKTSNRIRRYFPDFVVTFNKNGKKETVMVEVKPYAQTLEPKKTPKKRQKTFITEVLTYTKNYCKWEYARKFCEERGWTFVIMTEKQINGQKY